jgi:hypothetical protein
LYYLNCPEFRESIARGKIEADARVAEALYHRGCGYSDPAVKIFMPAGAAAPVCVPYVKHYPPDTKAALGILARRHPEEWGERQRLEVTGTIKHRLMQMTPDERAAHALDLAERIRRRVAESGPLIENEREVSESEAAEVEEDRAPSSSVATGRRRIS